MIVGNNFLFPVMLSSGTYSFLDFFHQLFYSLSDVEGDLLIFVGRIVVRMQLGNREAVDNGHQPFSLAVPVQKLLFEFFGPFNNGYTVTDLVKEIAEQRTTYL